MTRINEETTSSRSHPWRQQKSVAAYCPLLLMTIAKHSTGHVI